MSSDRPRRCDGCSRFRLVAERIEETSADLCSTCSYLLDRSDRDRSEPWDHYELREVLDVEECGRCDGRGYVGGPHHATMSDCPNCTDGIEAVEDGDPDE
jgi:hypothetical protein